MERERIGRYDIVCGIDVGKFSHFATAVKVSDGEVIASFPLSAAGDCPGELASEIGGATALVVVDQPRGFGEGLVAALLASGFDVGCICPSKFAAAAGLWGEDKDDAIDSRVLAEAALAMPHLVDPLAWPDPDRARARELSCFRSSLVKERTACSNRLHALLHRADPALEAFFAGVALRTSFALAVLSRYGTAQALRKAGPARVKRWIGSQKGLGAKAQAKVDALFGAIGADRACAAPDVVEREVKRLARTIAELTADISELDALLAAAAASMPEARLLSTMDGVGPVFSVCIASEIGDVRRFGSAAKLAAYAGVAPVRRESGTSVRGSRMRRGGNRRLKNAFVESAAIACRKEGSWEARRYAELRARGKGHCQALLVIARKRVDVIYRMLADNEPYDSSRKAA